MPSALSQLLERIAGLLLGEAPDGRSAADGRIVVLHFLGAGRRNQPGQGLASEPSEGKINNIGIAKEIKKKRLDRLQACQGRRAERVLLLARRVGLAIPRVSLKKEDVTQNL